MTQKDEYPLWCVDTGYMGREYRYHGPLASYKAAATLLAPILSLTGTGTIRRCRRAAVPVPDDLLGYVMEWIEEPMHSNPPDGEHYANWEDELVETKLGASTALAKALRRWADEYLVSQVLEVEPMGSMK